MLDYHNYNIYDKNGEELVKILIDLVENKNWIEGKNYFFHAYPGDSKKIPRPINYCFMILPHPKRVQVRSGVVKFQEKAPTWSDLKPFVKHPVFPGFWKTFLRTKIKDTNFEDPRNQACVLLCFEIARRASIEADYPLNRDMTRRAIDKVMVAPKATYSVQVRPNNIILINWTICYKCFF